MLKRIFDSDVGTRTSARGSPFSIIFPFVIFLLLILWSFSKVIITPGIVGHTWDWAIPNYTEQFLDKSWSNFFIWDQAITAGRYFPLRLELLYWIFILPFSVLGGATVSKLIPIFFLLIAASAAYKLARDLFGTNILWSTIAGVFYMFSPFAYSRIIAGHLPILFGYAVLPLVALYFWRVFLVNQDRAKNIIMGGLLFAVESLHPSTAILSFTILGVIFFFSLLKKGARRKIIGYSLILVLIFLLLNFFWLFPLAMSYFSEQAILHGGGLSVSPKSQVTLSSEMEPRVEYLKSVSQPLSETFQLHSRTGMDTEYIYPVPSWLKTPWIVIAFLFPLLAFGGFLVYWRQENVLVLGIIGLLGILLASGVGSLPGSLIYFKFLKKFLPLVFFEFSHPNRALPLVIISYSVLVPYLLQFLARKFHRQSSSYLFCLLCLIMVLIFAYPFTLGSLSRPLLSEGTQPFSLKVTKENLEEKKVYNFLRGLPQDFRIAYLPPASLSWPGETDVNFPWTSMYAPKSELLGWQYHQLNETIISNLFSRQPSNNLSKVFGLASVKYLVYPKYNYFFSYRDFLPDYVPEIMVDGLKDYKPIIDENLRRQTGLVAKASYFKNVTILENKHFIPHIYASITPIVVISNLDILPRLADKGYLDWLPAIFFSPQQDMNHLKVLYKASNKVLSTKEVAFKKLIYLYFQEDSLPKISFKRVNPTRYIVRVEKAVKPFFLVFSESYHPQWKAYVKSGVGCRKLGDEVVAEYPKLRIKEGRHEMKFTPGDISYLFRKPLTEDSHFLVNGYANAWYVDPARVDKDGDGKFAVTLYFWPQSLFYLGLMISGATFLSCIVYLSYSGLRKKK